MQRASRDSRPSAFTCRQRPGANYFQGSEVMVIAPQLLFLRASGRLVGNSYLGLLPVFPSERSRPQEFTNRALMFGLIFGFTFPLYFFDHQNSTAHLAREQTVHKTRMAASSCCQSYSSLQPYSQLIVPRFTQRGANLLYCVVPVSGKRSNDPSSLDQRADASFGDSASLLAGNRGQYPLKPSTRATRHLWR
jgi:hypothetical protein